MKNEAFYATAAQVLPALVIAGSLELRYFFRRLADIDGDDSRMFKIYAHVYTRFLALCTLASAILTVTCLFALKDGPPGYLDTALYYAVPFTAVAIALPLLGAVVDPWSLNRWYDEPGGKADKTT